MPSPNHRVHSWMMPYRINQEMVVDRNELFDFKNFNTGNASDDNKILVHSDEGKRVFIKQSHTPEGNIKLNISMSDKSKKITPKEFVDTVNNIFTVENALAGKIISCRPFKPESSKSKTDLESGHFNKFANYVEDPDIRKGMKFGEAVVSLIADIVSLSRSKKEEKEEKEIEEKFNPSDAQQTSNALRP
jgi:hypothetical protein